MTWTGSEYRCTKCPKRCSYGAHVHKFEKRVMVLDVQKMDEMREKIKNKLKDCFRIDSPDFLFEIN